MKVASLKAEVDTVIANVEITKAALQEKLEGAMSIFLDIQMALDLAILLGKVPIRRLIVLWRRLSSCRRW